VSFFMNEASTNQSVCGKTHSWLSL
jgi:hypothetical protein